MISDLLDSLMKTNLVSSKRSQAWGIDLIVALTVFAVIMVTFFIYAINYSHEGIDKLQELRQEGKVISDSLLSEGSPANWNLSDVSKPGLTSSGMINDTKLEEIYDLNNTSYQGLKDLLSTQYDFYFFLSENMIISGKNVEGIGKNYTNPKDLIKITRFTVYKDKPVTLTLYVWED